MFLCFKLLWWLISFLRLYFYSLIFLIVMEINHSLLQTIEKGEYSFNGTKGFFTARLQTGLGAGDSISVNFILSAVGDGDDTVWLVDSMLIRPQSMRRRRRK